MSRILLAFTVIALTAGLTAARADHMSPWGPGWANMPNDIHNTRLDTRLVDNEAFRDFVRYGEGADSTNQYLEVLTAALEAELDAGHQVDQIAARLDPLPDFLGGGWARYNLFDEDPAVSRVLSVSLRLRLVRNNGTPANEPLGLTAENAGGSSVTAYFRPYDGADYALCSLVFDGLISGEDDIPLYAAYSLSIKEDQTGFVEGTGVCAATLADPAVPILPEIAVTDLVDIGVWTPAIVDEVRPVLMGGF